MNKIVLYLIIFLCASTVSKAQLDRSTPPKPGPAPTINIGDYETFALPNGLKVIVVANHKTPTITWQLTLDIDPVQEKNAAGYVGIAGQLMRAGTTNRTKQEIDEQVDFMGASLSTYSTGIYGASLSKHKEKLLELMADVLYNPVFPQEELDKTVEQYISGLTVNESDANSIANNISTVVRYGTQHPYGEVETKESLKNITRDMLVNYYNTFFKPNVAYLVVVGDITNAEAKKLVEKYFSDWKQGNVPVHNYPVPTAPAANSVAVANRDGAVQSVINITYPVVLKPGDPDAIKADVTNGILGGGVFAGRLMQNLREDKAYTYGAHSSLNSNKLVGNFSARTEVRTNVTDSAVVEILYEMKRMVDENVDQKSLDLVKNYMNGNFARSLESPRTIANFALNIERYKLPKDYYKTYLEKLATVTASDVRDMAKKYIRPENSWIVVVGNKDEVTPLLKKFSKNEDIKYFDAYGRPLKESGAEIPAGMTAQKVLEKFIDALGGRAKLESVKDITMKMSTSMQGMNLDMVEIKSGGKFINTISMGGNVIQKQVFDGQKGSMSAMGQKIEVDEKMLESMKEQAAIFSELEYGKPDYNP
ncbi:MAG: insulinase family protein, partial [Prolixibacteraceae bacterium]|nr:insulinase family protein [Prolixibacteraceae bacterium]